MSNSGSGDYSDAPVSVGEVRSAKMKSCKAWNPRDVLVSLLREIDNGRLKPESLIVVYNDVNDDDGKTINYACAAPSGVAVVGMLTYAQHLMMEG